MEQLQLMLPCATQQDMTLGKITEPLCTLASRCRNGEAVEKEQQDPLTFLSNHPTALTFAFVSSGS